MGPRVRQVITLGTPFNWTDDHTNVGWLMRLMKGESAEISPALGAHLREPPPVPTVSVYSRSDGVVAWQSCQQARPVGDVQDVEVEGSHLGMGWNPEVLQLVGDSLARPRARVQRSRAA